VVARRSKVNYIKEIEFTGEKMGRVVEGKSMGGGGGGVWGGGGGVGGGGGWGGGGGGGVGGIKNHTPLLTRLRGTVPASVC